MTAVLASCSVASTDAPAAEPPGLVAHRLAIGSAALGTAQLREQQTGLQWRTAARPLFDGTLQAGIDYAYTRFEITGLPTRDRDLHHARVPLAWQARDARWTVLLAPIVATSSNVFKDLVNRGSSADVDLHAAAVFDSLGAAPGAGWRAGLARDTSFGAPRVYPVAALHWRTATLQAELGVPRSRVAWQAAPRLVLGAGVVPAGARWHVVSDERGGADFDFTARAWRAALTAEWRPWRGLLLHAEAGSAFARRFEFEDDTGAAIRQRAGSAPFVRVALGWRW